MGVMPEGGGGGGGRGGKKGKLIKKSEMELEI